MIIELTELEAEKVKACIKYTVMCVLDAEKDAAMEQFYRELAEKFEQPAYTVPKGGQNEQKAKS